MKKEKVKLTKTFIDSLDAPEDGNRLTYWDEELKGFCIRVSKGKKVYYAVKRVGRKLQWVNIGVHGPMNPTDARKEALKTLAELNKGVNVNREKAKARTKGTTLEDIWDMYIKTRPNLRDGTTNSYKNLIENHLSSWLKTPMDEITGEMVSKKHLDIVDKAKRNKIEKIKKKEEDQEHAEIEIAEKYGYAQANKVMRVLRLLFNYYSVIADKPVENPVKRLSNTRQWFKVERKKRIIKATDLGKWYDSVKEYSNPIVRDYLFLLLFTGLREREGMKLKWADVDMNAKTLTIRSEIAKNHQEHTLPMSPYLYKLFNQRLALKENEWVFPGYKEGQPIAKVRRAIEHVTKETGIEWSLHDLRRTFSTFAEQEVSYAVLKRLLNHSQASDVTAGYLVISTEQLRDPMNRVTNRILAAIKGRKSKSGEKKDNVLQFGGRKVRA